MPTVIALAIYFCFADLILITQCIYYNKVNSNRRQRQVSTVSAASEDEPLLTRARSRDATGLPGSHRRRSSGLEPDAEARDVLTKGFEAEEPASGGTVRNMISVLLVILVGAGGWALAWQSGVWSPQPEEGHGDQEVQTVALGAEILGYFSAVCYLG